LDIGACERENNRSMVMTAETIMLFLGGVLVLTGILGGGFEVKEIKIPRIGTGSRLLSAAAGILFLLWGAGMHPPTPPASEAPVTVTIRDALGDDQVSEQVRVLVNGNEMGMLTVNEHYPLSTLTVTVPKEGQYSYMLEARAVFVDEDGGGAREIVGAGQGAINIRAGKTFELSSTLTGDTWLAHVEEVRP
jgi:hypothetical protein